MSELIIANKSDIVDIADAVRSQTGETNLLSLTDIAYKVNTFSSVKSTAVIYFVATALVALFTDIAAAETDVLSVAGSVSDFEKSEIRP